MVALLEELGTQFQWSTKARTLALPCIGESFRKNKQKNKNKNLLIAGFHEESTTEATPPTLPQNHTFFLQCFLLLWNSGQCRG